MQLWAKFIYGIGEQGESGFILKGQPNFDPAGFGFTFAHDALEHFPDGKHGDNGLANELMALGALLYGRGQGDAFEDGAEDILRQELGEHVLSAYYKLATPPHRIERLRSEQVEGWIAGAIDAVRDSALAEGECVDGFDSPQLDATLNDMACWLRIGFHRAKRRYCGQDPDNLSRLFRKVAEDFAALQARENRLKGYGIPGEQGDQLRLYLDPKTLDSELRLVRLDDLTFG